MTVVGMLNRLQPLSGILVFGKTLLVGAKFGGVDQDPAAANARLVFDMQHLVEHDVVHDKRGDSWSIKDSADVNAVARCVVPSERAARSPFRPGDPGFAQAASKVPAVQPVETDIKVHITTRGALARLDPAS